MKYFIIILLIAITAQTNAQVPQKMSYQAVIRDVNNNLLSLKNINMRISIIRGELESDPVYSEIQSGKTNLNGLISLQIGTGILTTGDFKKIDWSKGPYFIKTETDPDQGFDFKIIGSSELLSVPYALYSTNSNFDTTYIYTNLNRLETQSLKNKNDIQINLDSLKSNVIQTQISVKNIATNTIDIEKNLDSIQKNTIDIKTNLDTLNSKINSVDLTTILKDYQKLGKFVSAISLQGVDSFDVNINGNFIASKNVTIGGNIESLGATSTLGTLEKPFKGLFISSGSLSIASDSIGLNIPAAVLSNVEGNLQISAGGLKLMGDNTSFIAPRIVSTLTGNASSATKLDSSRKINGVDFDGTKNIIIATTSANAITYTNTGTGDLPGGIYDGSLAKTISYNSLGASPLVGSSSITTVGTLSAGSIPFTLLTGTIPIWNQSTLGNAATVTTNANLTGMVTSVGNATTVVTNANLTGVVTSVGNVTSIASGTITNSMIANTAVANLTGTNTGDQTSVTGNAGTATKLAATKLINGVAFDGSSDITIASSSANSLTYTNSGTGDVPGGSYNGSIAKTISYNSIGASPLAGSTFITSVGTLSAGAIPYSLLTGTVPIWNQSSTGNAATVTTNANLTGMVTSVGNVTTVVTNANLTGVVTSIGNVTSIASGTITNSMIANTAVTNLSGINTGDESTASIKTKLGITTLTGSNTGDQVLPTLATLGGVASNTAITGATKTKITYDAKGLVTAGVDATTADIAASTNKNYVTDVQAGVLSNTSGTNTGDETLTTIKSKLGITTLSGSNTGDQILPTLASLGGVASNTAITGATKTKITYDAKGLVTAGVDATTADIAASTNKNYVTDVQAGVLSNTSGTNTGDETLTTIKTKLGITTLTGTNTGDQTNITGNAATVTTNANLTGVVTSIGNVTSIANGIITNSMIANTAVTNLTGTNTGDQVLPTLATLGGVASNTAITGATKTKITYDAKGLVTAGVDATTADITASINRNYVTDVQAGVLSNTSGTNTGDQTITLTGDITGTGTGTFTSTLANTAVVAASYGSSTTIPTFTVDAKGRLTTAGIVSIIADAGTLSGTITTIGKVANSATTATNLNTASTIVARDASGNFAAGLITVTSLTSTGIISTTSVSAGTITAANLIVKAGTATVAPISFTTTSAALKTTSAKGDLEVDASGIPYYSQATSSRGVINVEQFMNLSSAYTLTSQTAAQKLFNTTTNGALTVTASTTYWFECSFSLSSLANGTIGFAIGGTATLTSIGWQSIAFKNNTSLSTPAAALMSYHSIASQNVALINGQFAVVRCYGTIRVNAGGTIIPQVTLGTAAAGIVGANSYFRMVPLGSNTVTNVGNFN